MVELFTEESHETQSLFGALPDQEEMPEQGPAPGGGVHTPQPNLLWSLNCALSLYGMDVNSGAFGMR